MKVLITGGTGSLGRELVRAAFDARHAVRVLSRHARPPSGLTNVEWVPGDLASSGEGVRAAVAGVGGILHAASDARRAELVDVQGTQHLVKAAHAARVAHIVYISIVGIDDIPYSYYRRKRKAEEIIKASGVPHTILRATQFHSLVNFLIAQAARLPLVLPLPTDFKFQSVAEFEVSERLIGCLAEGARGRVEDFGGPEVLSLGEMAETWMQVKGVRKRVFPLPVPGAVAVGFRAGRNTAPAGVRGVTRWREWLVRNRHEG